MSSSCCPKFCINCACMYVCMEFAVQNLLCSVPVCLAVAVQSSVSNCACMYIHDTEV